MYGFNVKVAGRFDDAVLLSRWVFRPTSGNLGAGLPSGRANRAISRDAQPHIGPREVAECRL